MAKKAAQLKRYVRDDRRSKTANIKWLLFIARCLDHIIISPCREQTPLYIDLTKRDYSAVYSDMVVWSRKPPSEFAWHFAGLGSAAKNIFRPTLK